MKKYPVPRESAQMIVQLIMNDRAHGGAHGESAETFMACSIECESQVLDILTRANVSAAALRKLAAAILQMTRDPRRYPIVACMYAIAYRRGDDDAGYSWATMVMEGLVPTNSKKLDTTQSQAATAIYSQLARKGHAQAQFGMGRLVLAKVLSIPDADTNTEAIKQVQMAVDLWQRAGCNGFADAWYELGQLYYNGRFVRQDKSRGLVCLEHGARGGSAQASHALGTIYLERARSSADQNDMEQAATTSALAARYFLQAAQMGHAASAHNIGLLYLRTEKPDKVHKALHGVLPDDRNAREWFGAAASKNFLPSMMNYGAMLMEGRGAPDHDTRATDLDEARSVYTRALEISRRMLTRPTSALHAHGEQNSQQVARHMQNVAEAALRVIDERQRTLRSQSVRSAANSASSHASPQGMCSIM